MSEVAQSDNTLTGTLDDSFELTRWDFKSRGSYDSAIDRAIKCMGTKASLKERMRASGLLPIALFQTEYSVTEYEFYQDFKEHLESLGPTDAEKLCAKLSDYIRTGPLHSGWTNGEPPTEPMRQ